MEKSTHANGNKKKAVVAILISDKIDFKQILPKRQRKTLHNDKESIKPEVIKVVNI